MSWLSTEQKEYVDILIKTELRSPFIMQRLIDTRMTANQVQEFNKQIKSFGRKLIRNKYNYSLVYLK